MQNKIITTFFQNYPSKHFDFKIVFIAQKDPVYDESDNGSRAEIKGISYFLILNVCLFVISFCYDKRFSL